MAEGAGELAAVTRPVGMRGVFDNEQFPFPGDGHDGLHIRGLSREVDRDNRPGARRNGGFDCSGVEVEGIELNVRENRHCVRLDHRGRRREERVGRDYDLVLGANARSQQRDAQRDRAVDDGDAVPAAVLGCESILELGDFRAVQPPPLATVQSAEQAFLLRLSEDRPGREWFAADGCSAKKGEFL
jgi:hypothetical protein